MVKRRFLLLAAAMSALVLAALALLASLDAGRLKPRLESFLSGRLGAKAVIHGRIGVSISPRPGLGVGEVDIAFPGGATVHARRVTASLSPGSLLAEGEPFGLTLRLEGAEVAGTQAAFAELVAGLAGAANGTAPSQDGPATGAGLPIRFAGASLSDFGASLFDESGAMIGRLELGLAGIDAQGRFSAGGSAAGTVSNQTQAALAFSTSGRIEAGGAVQATLWTGGRVGPEALRLAVSGKFDPNEAERRASLADLSLDALGLRLNANGTLGADGFAGFLAATVADPARTAAATGVGELPLWGLSLSGRARLSPDALGFEDFSLKSPLADLTGRADFAVKTRELDASVQVREISPKLFGEFARAKQGPSAAPNAIPSANTNATLAAVRLECQAKELPVLGKKAEAVRAKIDWTPAATRLEVEAGRFLGGKPRIEYEEHAADAKLKAELDSADAAQLLGLFRADLGASGRANVAVEASGLKPGRTPTGRAKIELKPEKAASGADAGFVVDKLNLDLGVSGVRSQGRETVLKLDLSALIEGLGVLGGSGPAPAKARRTVVEFKTGAEAEIDHAAKTLSGLRGAKSVVKVKELLLGRIPRPLDFTVDVDYDYDVKAGSAKIRRLAVQNALISLDGSGEGAGLGTETRFKGRARFKAPSGLAFLVHLGFGVGLAELEPPPGLDGPFDAQANFDISRAVQLMDNLTLKSGERTLTGRLKSSERPGKARLFEFDAAVDLMNLDAPPPKIEPGLRALQEAYLIAKAKRGTSPPSELDPEWRGKIQAKKVLAAGALFTDADARMYAKSNDFNLKPLTAGFYAGRFEGELVGKFDPEFEATLTADLKDYSFEALIRNLGGGESAGGKAQSRVEMSARGLKRDQFLSSLNGKVSLDVTNGFYSRPLSASELAARQKAVAAGESLSPDAQHREKEGRETYRFSKAGGTFVFTNGVGRNEGFQIYGGALRAEGRGELDLPGNRIDYTIKVIVAETQAYPLRLTGKLNDPNVHLDAPGAALDTALQVGGSMFGIVKGLVLLPFQAVEKLGGPDVLAPLSELGQGVVNGTVFTGKNANQTSGGKPR